MLQYPYVHFQVVYMLPDSEPSARILVTLWVQTCHWEWWVEVRTTYVSNIFGQISSRPHTTDFPQKVANWKGNPLISGKSRLVKYYSIWTDIYLKPQMTLVFIGGLGLDLAGWSSKTKVQEIFHIRINNTTTIDISNARTETTHEFPWNETAYTWKSLNWQMILSMGNYFLAFVCWNKKCVTKIKCLAILCDLFEIFEVTFWKLMKFPPEIFGGWLGDEIETRRTTTFP